MASILYPTYTILHLLLLLWGFFLWRRGHTWSATILLVVGAGLVYDNLIVSIGSLLDEGGLLQGLNQGRFLLHVLLTPLLIVAGLELARYAHVKWSLTAVARIVIWIIVAGLIAIGFITGFWGKSVVAETFQGTLRYVHPESEFPIAPVATIVVLIIIGLTIYRKNKWLALLVGGIVMFIAAAIPPSQVGPAVGSGGEVVLMASLWLSEMKLWQRSEFDTHAIRRSGTIKS